MVEKSHLRSQFLLDLKDQFLRGRPGLQGELVEFREEAGETVLDESLETLRYVTRGQELFVYQTLTIWGDHVATYTVRESVRKRMYRLMHQVREYPLPAAPADIVDTFWWAAAELRRLAVPPGVSSTDLALLQGIEKRWLELSAEPSH